MTQGTSIRKIPAGVFRAKWHVRPDVRTSSMRIERLCTIVELRTETIKGIFHNKQKLESMKPITNRNSGKYIESKDNN